MTSGFREEELDLERRPKKGRKEKDSSRSARRGFSRAQRAFAGRLARPGYAAACHSKLPEALVKITGDAPRGQNVRTLLHYISRTQGQEGQQEQMAPTPERDQNVYLWDSCGAEYRSQAEVKALADEWVELFEAGKVTKRDAQVPDTKRKKRDVQHLILSAKADVNPQNVGLVLEAAKTTAAAMFAEHDYVLGVHQDGKYPHVHLVVRCDNNTPHKAKLRINKPELLQLRTIWARELTRHGLEHVATLRQDRPHVMAAVAEGKEKIRGQRKTWFQATLADKDKGLPMLAKRQADLAKALERQDGKDEAQKIRLEIGQRINDLRAHIKASSKQADPGRRSAFTELLKIERELKKHADPLLRFRELAEKPGTHTPAYRYIAQSLETGKRLPVVKPSTQEEIQKAYELHMQSIAQAKAEAVRAGGMTKEQFRVAMQVLEIQDRTMRKALGLPDKPTPRPRAQEQHPAQTPTVAPVKTPRDSGREL